MEKFKIGHTVLLRKLPCEPWWIYHGMVARIVDIQWPEYYLKCYNGHIGTIRDLRRIEKIVNMDCPKYLTNEI